MSVTGEKLAIISAGMSCQTTNQIRRNLDLISELTGHDDLRESTCYFDWLMAAPRRLASFIDEGCPVFTEPDEIIVHGEAPRCQSTGVYYWHAFRNGSDAIDVDGTFEDTKAKFHALKERFYRLAHVDRLITVVSNTQNNLDDVAKATGDVNPKFEPFGIDALRDSIESQLDRTVELIIVTRDDRYLGENVRDAAIYRLAPDETEWKGDRDQWSTVFQDYFERM